jgi:phage baseplate assembly protein W
MTSNKERELIKRVNVAVPDANSAPIVGRAYRGISTVDPNRKNFRLYDLELIKQDLINHFHIRQGEKLENPEFGTIIWDVIFEQLTDDLKEAISENVTTIVNYDPRIVVNQITVDSYENGIQIECDLTYLPYNISESLQLQFDRNNGLIS